MMIPTWYSVNADLSNGGILEKGFRRYSDAKAYFDSLSDDLPYKSITTDTEEGTKVIDRGGYESA